MLDSILLYCGAATVLGGALAMLRRKTRSKGAIAAASGALMIAVAIALPAREEHVGRVTTKLDEVMPIWQFRELHTIRTNASPDRVYTAIREVRANEIALFKTLTAIRRGFRKSEESILNPSDEKPILDVATSSGFKVLSDDPPHEIVIGTNIGPRTFAVMNFMVIPDGKGSIVSTETRIYARSERARRRFGLYWKIIHPGSDILRRTWLRAIKRRAESSRA